MRHKPLLSVLLLATGLTLAGCADGDAQSRDAVATSAAEDTAGATSSQTPAESSTSGATVSASPTTETSRTPGTSTAPEEPPVVEPHPEETPVRAINPPYSTAPEAGAPGPQPPNVGGIPPQNFSYDEAYAAWQNGMPYYDAFCLHYTPVTAAGMSQCEGIEVGTVDAVTGEYIGPR